MPAIQDILNIYSLTSGGETETRIDAFAREVFLPDAPLFLTLPMKQAPGDSWSVVGSTVRPQTYTLNGAILSGGTTLTLTDTTSLQVGDILEMFATGGASTDRMLVTAVPSSTTVTVQRAFEGTTAVANDNTGNKTVRLIGTASTGSEVNKTSFRNSPSAYNQRLQTFMYRVAVGGLTNTVQNVVLPNGMPSPLSHQQQTKLVEAIKDVQTSMYFGKGQARGAVTDRPTMLGIREIIRTFSSGANIYSTASTNLTQIQWIQRLVQKAVDGGGSPDLFVCSTDWLSAFATWSIGKQQFTEHDRTNILGLNIDRIFIPFGQKRIEIMYDYNLPAGTGCLLTRSDVMGVQNRALRYKPAGSRGDAEEGDYIGDYSIEAGHPSWHSWIENVASYA